MIRWQWRNRNANKDWENIEKPEVFYLQMEYRKVRINKRKGTITVIPVKDAYGGN